MRSSTLLLVLGIAASTAVTLGGAGYHYAPRSPVVQGLYIGERRVPDEGSPVAWLSDRQRDVLTWGVRLHHDGEIIDASFAHLGIEIDIKETLERASEVGHTGSFVRRYRDAARARRGEVDVPLVFFVDEKKARAFLETIAPKFYRAPVDAVLDIENKRKVEDEPGRELDIDACIDELRAAPFEDGVPIRLVTRRVAAKVTSSQLAQVDVTRIVASFDTTFTTWGSGAGRSVNIRNAARKIDGIVIPVGGMFSFNDRVGPRTRENGFTLAPEIQGDELTDGYGGGTCQLSSTLHAAAVFGGLRILRRQNHSRASSYVKLGLDATVHYPLVDLQIENALPYDVMIHAYLPEPGRVRVEILGGDPIAKVEYAYGVGQTYDFVRRITVKPHLPSGKRIHRQKGVPGFDVTSTVRMTYNDGRVEERRWFSGYRPSPEVYWVSEGYDETLLPALPQRAKGIEGRLAENVTEPASYPME
ncbi:MAG: VanW family protein [Polyangiaceae bacterium]|nr:VanW family protein [Polyangiaceae bacterium]